MLILKFHIKNMIQFVKQLCAVRGRLFSIPNLPQYSVGRVKDDPSAQRSATMRAVKSRDTAPELRVRGLLRAIAPGYRLHRRDLPGSPDIAYLGKKRAIFVHGCFWHGHDCARGARTPKANAAYWTAKIARNRARDEAHRLKLDALGWRTLTLWECELKDDAALLRRLQAFLASD